MSNKKHIQHALHTGWDMLQKEGIGTLIYKFLRYYLFSIVFIPIVYIQTRRFDHVNSIPELVTFIRNENFGVLQAGQVPSEITTFLEEIWDSNPKVMVEIGTANGGTLFALSRVLHKNGTLISIDLPNGEFGGGYQWWKIPFYKTFVSAKQTIHLLRKDSHEQSTLTLLREILNGKKIDLLFIDGDHTYEGVKKDYDMYAPLVRKGGIVALHDIVNDNDEDGCKVKVFWNELKETSKGNVHEIIGKEGMSWGGIGVIQT